MKELERSEIAANHAIESDRIRMMKKVFFNFICRVSLSSDTSLTRLKHEFESQEKHYNATLERLMKIKRMVERRDKR